MTGPTRAGRFVAHYRLIAPLGWGGMGTIYEAEDTRLGRRVAVKLLPPGRAHDEPSVRRFLREARAISSLNHPRICSVYDAGEDGGQPFIAMELLEGRTLQHVIGGKPLPPDRVLTIGAQIAEALEVAHARGLTHRDIKPANVFVTRQGDVKLLDFGLAKFTAPSGADAGSGVGPETDTSVPGPLSASGAVAGTVAFMSPEQARGEELDARTDLFSLGAVIYEMATGRVPFPGDTAAVVFEGILNRPAPAIRASHPEMPAALDVIVGKALEKDRNLRYQTAADLRVDLLRAMRGPATQPAHDAAARPQPQGAAPAASSPGSHRWVRRVAGALVAVLLLAAGLGAGRWLWDRPHPHFVQLTFRQGIITSARFTTDGRTVVFSALWDGGPPEIFSRRLESSASVSLGLPPAALLAVSTRSELAVLLAPPGERGVVWLGTLARVPLSGGVVRPVLESVLDADWSPDGRDLAVLRWREGAFQLEYPIGIVLMRPCPATKVRVSPDGLRVAVLDDSRILVLDRAGAQHALAVPPLHQRLAWAPDGQAILVDAGASDLHRTLQRVRLDGRVEELAALAGTLVVHDVARDGRVLIHHGFERWAVRARAPGEREEHDASAFTNSAAQGLTGDGRYILLWDSSDGPPGSLLLQPTIGGPAVRIGEGQAAVPSSDGRRVVTWSSDAGRSRFVLLPTAAGEPMTVPLGRLQQLGVWHVDDKVVGFSASEPGRPRRSFVATLADGAVRAVTPEGTLALPGLVGPGLVLARSADGSLAFYPVSPGGVARPVPATLPRDPFASGVVASADGRSVLARRGSVPAVIERIDLQTGRATPWASLAPPEPRVAHIWSTWVTADGRAYIYTYGFYLQDLFLVDGLR